MKHRLLRVNELVKRQLSMIVTRDLRFENVLVTINQVHVTPDLKNAHVFVSVLGKGSAKGVIALLDANRVVLQAEMAKDVVLKYTPHLNFHLDDSIERGDRVFEILRDIDTHDPVDEAQIGEPDSTPNE